MERAGTRVVEVLEREFAPLAEQRVVIFCGKGNNGGDGLVVARLLEGRVAALQVVRVEQSRDLRERSAHHVTIVVDALLGTGFRGEVEGRYAETDPLHERGFSPRQNCRGGYSVRHARARRYHRDVRGAQGRTGHEAGKCAGG